MKIENLSNPGKEPLEGDFVEVLHSNGDIERRHHFSFNATATENRKNEIRQRLTDIDLESGTSRALREALIDLLPAGKGNGLRGKETEAAALRAEMAIL